MASLVVPLRLHPPHLPGPRPVPPRAAIHLQSLGTAAQSPPHPARRDSPPAPAAQPPARAPDRKLRRPPRVCRAQSRSQAVRGRSAGAKAARPLCQFCFATLLCPCSRLLVFLFLPPQKQNRPPSLFGKRPVDDSLCRLALYFLP